jgi:hypothetical protein
LSENSTYAYYRAEREEKKRRIGMEQTRPRRSRRLRSLTGPIGIGVVVLTAALVTGLGAAPAMASSAFKITKIVPAHEYVVSGTSKNLTIYWAGTATFPITVYDTPKPGCSHDGVVCGSGSHTFSTGTHKLVWKGGAECSPGFTTKWTGHWWVYLKDSQGSKTQKVTWTVTCTP